MNKKLIKSILIIFLSFSFFEIYAETNETKKINADVTYDYSKQFVKKTVSEKKVKSKAPKSTKKTCEVIEGEDIARAIPTSPGEINKKSTQEKVICTESDSENIATEEVVTEEKEILTLDKPLEIIIQEAHDYAKNEIWKKYTTGLKMEIREQISNLNISGKAFITNFNVTKESVDEKKKVVKLKAEAIIDEAGLMTQLKTNSAVGQITPGEASEIAHMITLRQAVKTISKNEDKSSGTKYDDAGIEESQTSNDSNKSSNSYKRSEISKKKEFGTTVVAESDKIQYEKATTISLDDVDAAFGDKFSTYNFEATPYYLLGEFGECERGDSVSADQIQSEYISEGTWKNKSKISALKLAKKCGMKYFVVGSVTIDSKRTMENNMVEVLASINIQVFDLKGRPRFEATTQNQLKGVGKTESSAVRVALRDLATFTAETIAIKLNSKGAK